MANQDFVTLQVIGGEGWNEGRSGHDPHSKPYVRTFDFASLVHQFDVARSVAPALVDWHLTDGLGKAATAQVPGASTRATKWDEMDVRLDEHLRRSDTMALGGTLAYAYVADGGLAGIDLGLAQTTLRQAQFGVTAQAVNFHGRRRQCCDQPVRPVVVRAQSLRNRRAGPPRGPIAPWRRPMPGARGAGTSVVQIKRPQDVCGD